MKKNTFILFLFILFALFFTFPLIFKIKTGIYGLFFNTDLRGPAWYLWWIKYAFIHHLNFNFSPFLCAPFGYELNQQNFFWISFFFSKWSTILTSPVLFLNISAMAGFVVSGFLMYRLVGRLTENEFAATISGLMFAFSPYHLNKIMEFGFAFHGCWIVLYVIALLRLRDKTYLKNIIFMSIAFALVLDFNAYYGLFCLVFTLGFLIFSSLYGWRGKFKFLLDKKKHAELKLRIQRITFFPTALLCVFLGTLVIEFPSAISLFKNFFFKNISVGQQEVSGYIRSFDYLVAQSARPLSYLLPASTHPVFGGFTKSMFGSIFYGRGSIEQTLYLGWIPLILSFIVFRQWKYKRSHISQFPEYGSSNENFYIGFFIFSAWLAFFFSMPPIVNLGFFKLYFPSYFTYKILPMFRAYARFGVIVMLCVSVLAGYGIKFILERIKTKASKWFFLSFIFLGIIFEFANMPPWRVSDLTRVQGVYEWLKQQPGDFIIAEYPMTLSSLGEAWTNYDYLFYQTKHQKRMVNGASPGTEAFVVKQKILRVDDKATPGMLKALGAKYVILHTKQYEEGTSKNTVEVVGEIPDLGKIDGYRFVGSFDSDIVYEVVARPLNLDNILKQER